MVGWIPQQAGDKRQIYVTGKTRQSPISEPPETQESSLSQEIRLEKQSTSHRRVAQAIGTLHPESWTRPRAQARVVIPLRSEGQRSAFRLTNHQAVLQSVRLPTDQQ